MKTPPLTTRFFGNPVVALCMWGWFLHALAGWYLLQPSIGETIFAGCFAVCSLTAWRKMRAHHAWLRQWSDTSQLETETPARIPASSRRKSARVFFPPVLGLMLVLVAANNARPEALPMLRLLAFGCVVWLVAAALARKFRKHGGGQESSGVKAETPSIVAWVAGPASCAPSRTDACKDLPGYCAEIMK
jgi:hypothetical protein